MRYLIISPAVLMVFPWVIVLFFYSFRMTNNLMPLSLSLNLLLTFVVCFFLVSSVASYFPVSIANGEKNRHFGGVNVRRLLFLTKLQMVVWGLGTLFEIYYSGGVPLFWSMLGDSRNYTDFGIPSFHGLMNAFYFSLVVCLFLVFKIVKRKVYLLLTFVFGLWPIFMLGRGIVLTVVVQLVIIHLFFSGISLRNLFYLAIVSVIFIVGFGVIGDVRGFSNPFSYLISHEYDGVFEYLPSGFLWVYIYITSPLSNLAFNFDNLIPVWDFYYSSVNLFPSILRPEGLDRADSFLFVDDSLNVSTIFASSHSDFGYLGDVVLLLLLAVWSGFWFKKLTIAKSYILPYSMVGAVMFFSIFYNLFLLYPYLFATVLLGFVAKSVKTN